MSHYEWLIVGTMMVSVGGILYELAELIFNKRHGPQMAMAVWVLVLLLAASKLNDAKKERMTVPTKGSVINVKPII